MNKRPVERALATLLPTHENEIPTELLALAQSLVAQSRSYSSSLKPEEEIARPHACAEIACRRLARSLKLPPLLGHPPCPPRVYKKLYVFLEKTLGGNTASKNSSTSGTPNKTSSTPKKNGADSTPSRTPSKQANQNATPSKSTPLGKRSLNPESNKTPLRATSVKRARFTQESPRLLQNIKDAPQWVMPAIRTVCKTLSTPAPRMSSWSRPPISRTLPPHIYAGVSSILHFVSSMTNKDISKLDEEETSDFLSILRMPEEEDTDDFKEVVQALIVAVYFLVLARRRSPSPNNTAGTTPASPGGGSPVSPSGEARKMDKKTFSEMRQTALSSLELPSNEKRHGEDVDSWIALIMSQKWAKGQEWFENVPVAGEREDELEDGSDDQDGDDENDGRHGQSSKRRKTNIFLHAGKDEEGLLLPGLGTMMQARVDYLSEDRREDYLEWKADILERIGQVKNNRIRGVAAA